MERIKFDGKGFAAKKEEKLKEEIIRLSNQGVFPRLSVIMAGDNPDSLRYIRMKYLAARRIGAQADIRMFSGQLSPDHLVESINESNEDRLIHGIMVQKPLPPGLFSHTDSVVETIVDRKDVDGLKKDSKTLHATSKAVVEIIDEAHSFFPNASLKTICVLGATGMVGRPLVKVLEKKGYCVLKCDINTSDEEKKDAALSADIVISTVGKEGLVTEDMVNMGVVLIDVGLGDIHPLAAEKASFVTPVMGGVGPVTISCLLENLFDACKKSVDSL